MGLLDDYSFPMSNKELQEAINSGMVNRNMSCVMEKRMSEHIETLLKVQAIRAKAMICNGVLSIDAEPSND